MFGLPTKHRILSYALDLKWNHEPRCTTDSFEQEMDSLIKSLAKKFGKTLKFKKKIKHKRLLRAFIQHTLPGCICLLLSVGYFTSLWASKN